MSEAEFYPSTVFVVRPRAIRQGYIWAGEHMSTEDDFFKPLHVDHLGEWGPQVLKYLGLSPGWRFLIAGEYEDVWFDPEGLDVR